MVVWVVWMFGCLGGWLAGWLVCCWLLFVVVWVLLFLVGFYWPLLLDPPVQTTPCGPGHEGVLGGLKPRMLLLLLGVVGCS